MLNNIKSIQFIQRLSKGFTLLEFLVIMTILSILAIIIIPRLIDYPSMARSTATKAILQTTRTAIDKYVLDSHASSGNGQYPTYETFITQGSVLADPLLSNPYNNSNAVCDANDSWVAEDPPVNPGGGCSSEGWNYDETNGKFWANSNSEGENLF